MNRQKMLKGTMIVLAVAALLALIAVIPSVHSSSEEEMAVQAEQRICYESYEVLQNDSLWKIAEQHAGSYGMTTAEYVTVLRQMNHLSGDRIITGQRLIVPYKTY